LVEYRRDLDAALVTAVGRPRDRVGGARLERRVHSGEWLIELLVDEHLSGRAPDDFLGVEQRLGAIVELDDDMAGAPEQGARNKERVAGKQRAGPPVALAFVSAPGR
jgi:hypothetical protein